jgi:hypothetical protein
MISVRADRTGEEIAMKALHRILGAASRWVGRSMAIMAPGMSGVPKMVDRAGEFTNRPKHQNGPERWS